MHHPPLRSTSAPWALECPQCAPAILVGHVLRVVALEYWILMTAAQPLHLSPSKVRSFSSHPRLGRARRRPNLVDQYRSQSPVIECHLCGACYCHDFFRVYCVRQVASFLARGPGISPHVPPVLVFSRTCAPPLRRRRRRRRRCQESPAEPRC